MRASLVVRSRRLEAAIVLGLSIFAVLPLTSSRACAQSFTTLHTFTGNDGANSVAALIVVSNRLYGTTSEFWGSQNGTVFTVKMDGSDFQTLHHFAPAAYDPDSGRNTNTDGNTPEAGLVSSGSRLYGTTYYGGAFGMGAIFALNIDGTGFTNLHSFGIDVGAYPWAPLTLVGDTLYGSTFGGGYDGAGTIFSLKTNGTAFTLLRQFELGNSEDGAYPSSELVLASGTFYSTAHFGGLSNAGVVFKMNLDGTGFTILHAFNNLDGRGPGNGKLTLSGSTLYGTTFLGGTTYSNENNAGYGTIFRLQTDGSGFSTLHNFSTNGDFAFPATGLVLHGDTLYGTAGSGPLGSTVFSLKTNGAAFTTVHNFGAATNNDGSGMQGDLLLSGDYLYGTTIAGAAGYGTIFRISLPILPLLAVSATADSLIFSWPTNATGFALQSCTNLSATGLWTTVTQQPQVLNGQNTLTLLRETNLIGQPRFYRLVR